MTCSSHQSPKPCPYCDWAASGDPVKITAAANRALRVAGLPVPPPAPIVVDRPPRRPTPGLARTKAVHALSRECPARYRESCGCAEPYRCNVRERATVTQGDCEQCLVARGVDLPPREPA